MKISQGFTLIEMAIVMIIMGFLIGGLLMPLSMQMNQQKIKDTQKTLETVKEALIGYAILNGNFPCPNLPPISNGKGTDHPCVLNKEGEIPWIILGVGRYDSWGNPIRYRLDDAYRTINFPVSLDTSSGLKIRDINDNPLTNETVGVNSNVIAVIYSCGKNGRPEEENDKHGYSGGANCSLSFSTTTKDIFTQDSFVENQFDDILTWLPKNILINQLVLAGKWPPP
ncbi:prepilin-type N-terminal cleavage/methylation domain-containing protein [Candidatus Halobeggiatoa sp. HSG11]|nr:prepilin-type N-terminal cleavage/methylation domain-containing protein [Candidatus Halobeggiatoa sp. HSG11]